MKCRKYYFYFSAEGPSALKRLMAHLQLLSPNQLSIIKVELKSSKPTNISQLTSTSSSTSSSSSSGSGSNRVNNTNNSDISSSNISSSSSNISCISRSSREQMLPEIKCNQVFLLYSKVFYLILF